MDRGDEVNNEKGNMYKCFFFIVTIVTMGLKATVKMGPHEGTCCKNTVLQNVAGKKSR